MWHMTKQNKKLIRGELTSGGWFGGRKTDRLNLVQDLGGIPEADGSIKEHDSKGQSAFIRIWSIGLELGVPTGLFFDRLKARAISR